MTFRTKPLRKHTVSVIAVLSCCLVLIVREIILPSTSSTKALELSAKRFPCKPGVVYRRSGLIPLKRRGDIGKLLEYLRFETGLEIGVQRGYMSSGILNEWTSCKSYSLVDLWGHQENYQDFANVADDEQQKIYEEATQTLKRWENITKFYRMYSNKAVENFEDESVDFIYVDARHDYCGVKEDISLYYPKLRPGGIIAGHDFHIADEVVWSGQDWSKCMDGNIKKGSVRGATEEFLVNRQGLTLSIMYKEENWHSWMAQKPTIDECVKDPAPEVSFWESKYY